MPAMRQHDNDPATTTTASRGVLPLVAATSLFVLGVLGLLGLLPLSPLHNNASGPSSPGSPAPLARAPGETPPEEGAPDAYVGLFSGDSSILPPVVREVAEEAIVVSASDSGGSVTGVELPTATPTAEPTETPEAEPTDTATPTQSPTATSTPTPTGDDDVSDLPNGSHQQPDKPVVVIVDPQPQPTPPGPGNVNPAESR